MFNGVCDLTNDEARAVVLDACPVADIWGIGRATVGKLAALGITTAAGLRDLDPKRARLLGTVTLERTVWELRGVSCLALEDIAPQRKGMAVTRSFGRPVTSLDELREAVATYASRAGEKLRLHGLVAGRLAAFCHTSPHREGPYFQGQRGTRLMPMTCDTRELVAAALRCLEAAWPGNRGLSFIKAGVLLDDLCTPDAAQPGLFDGGVKGSAKLMAAMDALNTRYGRNTVFPAAMGTERGWKLRAAHHSPRYTTRLDELPAVRA